MSLLRWCKWDAEYRPSPMLRAFQYLLLALIVIGVVLLVTQSFWVPKVVQYILAHDTVQEVQAQSSGVYLTSSVVPAPHVTLTGVYACLPFLPNVPKTPDCENGIYGDDGEYYAVIFGTSASRTVGFHKGARVTLRGIIIPRANLKPEFVKKFVMKGSFAVLGTPVLEN